MDGAGRRVVVVVRSDFGVKHTRMDRPRLAESAVERIRRERYAPRRVQFDYLHLRDLRARLLAAFAALPNISGPALDLFCGTQPYREMIPVKPVWGLDLARHFGRTDVIGGVPLPFADASFGIILCSQAIHMIDDPAGTVREIARVLKPGGSAIVTIPHIFRREIPQERKLSSAELLEIFAGWDATLIGFGGLGSALMCATAGIMNSVYRRWGFARALGAPAAILANAICGVFDAVTSYTQTRVPANLLLVATRTVRPHYEPVPCTLSQSPQANQE